jgi:hypothetical protein
MNHPQPNNQRRSNLKVAGVLVCIAVVVFVTAIVRQWMSTHGH